jgi:phosphoribosyl-AMP cyclohydrolase / phosphoribosyl-ATP pyrophosphohydrolase
MDLSTIRYNSAGLIPAVVQDATSGEVLMLAYMNPESIQKTLDTGETHFWSRSRRELWHKGETSGNVQKVKSIAVDCDGDTLLVKVEQVGNACHTGAHSCFFIHMFGEDIRRSPGEVLDRLAGVIHQRNLDRPEGSYTTKLLNAGLDRILKKVGEEAGEVIIAAKNQSKPEIMWEVADLLYHVLVMLELQGVTLHEVGGELEGRFVRQASQTGG